MQYDFDEIIDRRGTGALKYEALLPRWGRDDLIPLWVADMDFKTPPFIMEAIRRRCEHEILAIPSSPAPSLTPSGTGWAAATAGRCAPRNRLCPGHCSRHFQRHPVLHGTGG